MQEELKPCAHCGSPAQIKRGKTVMVSCTGCTATTFQALSDKDSAIAAWNRRTPVSGEVAEGAEVDRNAASPAAPAGQHKVLGYITETTERQLLTEEFPPSGHRYVPIYGSPRKSHIVPIFARNAPEASASPVPRAQGGITSDKLPTRYETPSGSRLYANSLSPTDMSDIRQARGQQAGGAEDKGGSE